MTLGVSGYVLTFSQMEITSDNLRPELKALLYENS